MYYWCDEFRPAPIEHTQVPVRYDPFDIGSAYAFVQGRWVACISEDYLQFKGHSERELLLATAELRKRQQNHSKEVSITAKRLAELLAEASAHEVLLTQRLQDVEAQAVFAQMGDGKGNESREQRLEEQAASRLSSVEQGQAEEKEEVYAGLEVYGEYR